MLWDIIIANLAISVVSFVGLLLFLRQKSLKDKNLNEYLVSLAAGVMLSAAFLSILPEALEMGDVHEVLGYALGGMVFGFLLERFLLWYHHHHTDTHSIKPTAVLVLVGDSIHNFIDGLAIAATFIVNPGIGVATTIAIAAHEIPQEFADFSILLHCGLSKRKAILFNFLSALMAVLGGIIGFYLLQQFGHFIPLALGLAAGIFIYVAAADLIPELHRENKNNRKLLLAQAVPFIIGVLMMMYISSAFIHAHEEDGHHEEESSIDHSLDLDHDHQ